MFNRSRKPPLLKLAPLSTLIAEGVEISGDVAFAGGMRVDGAVHGDIDGRRGDGDRPSLLVLSARGSVEGSIRCGNAVINGSVIGDLDVEHRLELQSDARVTGTIRYRQLQMDVGASVQGQLLKIEAAGNVVELVGGADKAAAVERR
ncbi:MAG: polymer-forming cytoskeletal protein [Caldimonas sp.]|nr:polymer-forming cytoskeletal protein [Pseudomonadota bacterium]